VAKVHERGTRGTARQVKDWHLGGEGIQGPWGADGGRCERSETQKRRDRGRKLRQT
jgi:hypothetical protein